MQVGSDEIHENASAVALTSGRPVRNSGHPADLSAGPLPLPPRCRILEARWPAHAGFRQALSLGVIVTTLARKRRRILDLAGIGGILISAATVTRESNFARGVMLLLGLFYLVAVVVLVLRVSRCPRCGSFLQRTICRGRVTIPGLFQSTCSECGWDESSEESPTREHDQEDARR